MIEFDFFSLFSCQVFISLEREKFNPQKFHTANLTILPYQKVSQIDTSSTSPWQWFSTLDDCLLEGRWDVWDIFGCHTEGQRCAVGIWWVNPWILLHCTAHGTTPCSKELLSPNVCWETSLRRILEIVFCIYKRPSGAKQVVVRN